MEPKTIILIGCSAKKAETACEARDLYQGALFKKAYDYAQSLHPDSIFILSAKHHVLELNDVVAPYNETLNGKKSADIKAWSDIVLEELKDKGCDLQNDNFILLAGSKYYKNLIESIPNYQLPYMGCKGIGYILQFLNKQLNP